MATREELLAEFHSIEVYRDTPKDDPARLRKRELRRLIEEIDQDYTGHVCCVCLCRPEDYGGFLGYHAYGRGTLAEVCDHCAETHGCVCCDIGNSVFIRGTAYL
jgi:hypothetical protein